MPTKRPNSATSASGISIDRIETAASVGRESEFEHTEDRHGQRPLAGSSEEQRQVHVVEAVHEGEDHAGEHAWRRERHDNMAQHGEWRRAEADGGGFQIGAASRRG